ncbi:MAG TPA: rhodanese-like domain-containing protein, partial [Bryobacteraceae bacterium]|nr:rhodanese-like domain-containing protein [Bryobacteraceae bacterium]
MGLPIEVSPAELKRRLDQGESIALVDVREPFEHQLATIDKSELIPMNTIPARLSHLEGLADDRTLVVYCHHGMRSLNVVNWLRQQGLENCQSLAGGIDQWSREVDPTIPR